MKRFLHSGHIGDIIAFLSCMKTMGGGELVITDDDGNVHLKMSGFKYESIEPLIAYQSYISRVWFSDNHTGVTHDLRQFRKHWGRGNIVVLHAAELGIEPKYDRWLDAKPSMETKGRIVCCRSPRYRNYNFPWKKILKRIGDRAVFVGTDDEHADMERLTGIKIDRHHVKNCLDIAEAIAGSDLFIGNQSSPYWVAAGLNHPCLQETNPITPDSMIQYDGAHFCINGFVDMGIFEKYGI
jgi:hypothetical protein